MSWSKHVRPQLADLSAYDIPPVRARARLNANECPYAWPAHVRQALGKIVADLELERYPDTSGRELRAILAERHGCAADRIVLGNGSDEVIALLLTTLAGRSQPAVVLPTPTFVMYAHSARVLGYAVHDVPLTAAFELDGPAMHAALARADAALCFLARPNNPTGSLWNERLVSTLVHDHPDTVFVIDEAYAAYAPGNSLWRADLPDNCVLMSTLSKVGLAALRVGYCIATPTLANELNKVRHPYNVSATSLALAGAVMTRFADEQAELVAKTIAGRERLERILARMHGARVFPSFGNLVLVRFDEPAHAHAWTQLFAEREILVKDWPRDPALAGCMRVSVGTEPELDALAETIDELSGQIPSAHGEASR